MSIEIKTKKVVWTNQDGALTIGREILSVKMLGFDELPKDYVMFRPSCWYYENGPREKCLYTKSSLGRSKYNIGDCLSEDKFQNLKQFLHECGDRLALIKQLGEQSIRDKEADWHGEETFVI